MNNIFDYDSLLTKTCNKRPIIKKIIREETDNIKYLCTPFSYKAACELNEIGVSWFKIGSGEMSDHPSLLKIAELGLPMILSTGRKN